MKISTRTTLFLLLVLLAGSATMSGAHHRWWHLGGKPKLTEPPPSPPPTEPPPPISGGSSCDVTAASVSSADVQSAINTATTGQTVCIPAGSAAWSTQVTISGKTITLQGAGIDVTTITGNVAGTADLSIDGQPTGTNFVSDLTFNGNFTAKGGSNGIITINTSTNVNSFRLHHLQMTDLGNRGIYVYMNAGADSGGLIDHFNCLKTGSSSVQCVTIDGSAPESRAPFARPLSLGTNKAIYIEDSTFLYDTTENDGALDAYNGARYVFRHNTTNATTMGHHGADSGFGAGMAGFEVYANTIHSAGGQAGNISRIMFWRSGVGVVFDNVADTTGGPAFTSNINVKNYRSCESFAFWGQCDGTNAWDENQSGQQGYACLDSMGHQFEQSQNGVNVKWGYYSWNNTKDGAAIDTAIEEDCAAAGVHLNIDVDIFNQVASFDGTVGIGRGLLSARPSTCTPIVGYFATDTSTLYRCSSTNTWTSYYTAFTYPHPLQGGSGGGAAGPGKIFKLGSGRRWR